MAKLMTFREFLEGGHFKTLPIVFLILINLIPVGGVLFFGWDLASIFLAFWVENVAIGIIAILKILTAKKNDSDFSMNGKPVKESTKIKGRLVLFFIIHYGMFTFAHGAFIQTGFGLPEAVLNIGLLMFLSYLISHYLSYRVNYMGGGEHMESTPGGQFFKPYGRVVVMHLVVIFGGFLIHAFGYGGAVVTLLLLIILKMLLDLGFHLAEHAAFAAKKT